MNAENTPLHGGAGHAIRLAILAFLTLFTLSVHGQVAQGTGGGTALAFDGASGFATVANSRALNAFPLTVMGWVRSSDQGNDRGIVNKYVTSSFSGYQVYYHLGHVRAWYFRDANNFVWDSGRGLDSGFVAGIWLHFAFTVDATGGKLYVNGVLRDSRPWNGTPGPTTQAQDLQFGRYANNFLNGEMDEVSVWNVALSPSEIASAMGRRLESNEPGLLAYWRFSEGSGSSVADAAPTAAGNNTATLFNGTSWVPSGAVMGPLVNTRGISGQTVDGTVNLTGEVNPLGRPATAWFEWGTTTSYGTLTTPLNVGASSNVLTAGALLSGLLPGQTYHYRYVATNANGRADGADQSFTQPIHPSPGGVPPLRSSAYDGGFASFAAFDPRPEWDTSVAMTVEAWVFRQDANRFETVVSHDAPGSYRLGFSPRLRFHRGTNFAEVPTPVFANKWTHIAVAYDGALARFYLNGELAGTRALGHNGTGKLRELLLGHDDSHNDDIGPINRFQGNLDEVRIWSVARSEAEIQDGLYREVRGEPGLAAVFPRGGRFEEITGLVGNVGSGVTEQVFGMAPRDLVVPRAAFPPSADGNINVSTEYLGADQLVIRYPDQPGMPDNRAYFVHTDTDLFVAVAASSQLPDNFNLTNSWLSLYIDTTNAKPALAEYPQIQLFAQLDGNTNHTTLLNGDGFGGYYLCQTPAGIGRPQLCTPRSLWQVGDQFCGPEIFPYLCTEFRVSRTLLGSFDEFDGVAIGQFNFSEFGDQTFVPEDGFEASPATWLTMSYGEGSASLPRVRWSGRVFSGLTNTTTPLPGYRVSLIGGGGAGASQLTDAFGRFNFDVPMPTNETIFAQAELEAFGRYTLPRVFPGGVQPQFIGTNRVIFPRLPGNAGASVQLASVDFFVQRPLLASAITGATPTNPLCGMAVRQGGIGGPGEVVTIFGTNLHAEMEFFMAPISATFPVTPEFWTLLRAPVVSRDPNGNWVKVQSPFVPEFVREYTGGVFIPSFTSKWRWVAHDSWFRPGRVEYSYIGNFTPRRPPYPILNGFQFDNQDEDSRIEEFLAGYGNSAYICVGAFGECATHVPDPLYWGLWYPVHRYVINKSGGSCVGISGTAAELFNRLIIPQDYDPLALTANGISDPGLPGEFDTSNTGGMYTRPPIPKDIWGRIRMNHGAQTSAEYMIHVLSQLDVGILSPHFGGNPVARLPELRAGTTAQAVCMVQGFDGGHCVTPYSVEGNFGGDPNKTRIWIYDNNNPCAIGAAADDPCVTNQFIDIDHVANEYDFPGNGWTGTALFTVPLSLYTGQRTAPGLIDFAQALGTFLVVVAGGADAHFTTPTGREWGWRADGTFVNNLPGVQAVPILGSPTNSTRSIPILLPVANGIPAIDIHMRDTNANMFHVASGGTLLQLESTVSQPGLSNRIRLTAVSNQLSSFRFTPQTTFSNFVPRVGFVISNGACATFQWMGLAGEAGRTQEFRALKNRRAVEYCNETTRPTSHYLRIDAVDGATTNNGCALFGPFTVPTGAVHCVVLQDWPHTKQVRSELDLNADGIPDQVTIVTGTDIDSDGDGMPDAWETLHQLNPLSATCDDGPDGDPDGDGVSNHGEYLSGTDPHDSRSAMRLNATMIAGNRVRLTWDAVPGRRYEILYANTFEFVFQPLPGAGFPRVATSTREHFDDTLPVGTARTRFYQLRLVP